MSAPTAVVDELAALLRFDVIGPVHDPQVGWPALLEVASAHRLLPALWSALSARGVRPLPDDLRHGSSPLAILEQAYLDNDARIRASRRQLVRVLDMLEGVDASPIPLKGSHWLLAGWLRDPAARVMVDIDVLVPRTRSDAATDILERYLYVAVPFDPVDGGDHQLAPMVAPRWPGSVEVHLEPIIGFHRRLLSAEEVRARAVVIDVDLAARTLPSSTDAVLLAIGHGQLQDESLKLLELPLPRAPRRRQPAAGRARVRRLGSRDRRVPTCPLADRARRLRVRTPGALRGGASGVDPRRRRVVACSALGHGSSGSRALVPRGREPAAFVARRSACDSSTASITASRSPGCASGICSAARRSDSPSRPDDSQHAGTLSRVVSVARSRVGRGG